jgi:hypothetical protein
MTASSLKWLDRFTGHKEPMSLPTVALTALATVGRTAAGIFTTVRASNAAADELFERAAAYESTQPSYAADLRAAAHLAQRRHFGDW